MSSSRSIVPDLRQYRVWFLTGSQGLYGEETLRQVAAQSQQVAEGLAGAADIPVTVEWKPVLTDPDAVTAQALSIATEGGVRAADGTWVDLPVRSLCLHGDTPGAVELARAVRARLAEEGVTLQAAL